MMTRKNFALASILALPAVACIHLTHAQETITLDATWSEWDPFGSGSGVQTLSGQSATGYTTSISGTVSETSEVPQVYQIFDPVSLANVGDKVELCFDVQFNSELGAINLDTDFRAGISSTANNSGAVYGFDAGGSAGGTAVRLRYDTNGLTDIGDPNDIPGTGYPVAFDENNLNHSLNASGTLGSAGGTPGGDVLGESTTEIHSFILTLEREAGGLIATSSWTSDAPSAATVDSAYSASADDSLLPLGLTNSIDMIQFALLEEDISTTYPASFTISNVKLTYVPEPNSLVLVFGSACAILGRRRNR